MDNQTNMYNTPKPADNTFYPEEPQKNDPKAIASLVLGIISIVLACCCTYLGIVCGIVGIVFAMLSKKDTGDQFTGMAKAGFICSIVGAALCVVSMIAGFIIGATFNAEMLKNL